MRKSFLMPLVLLTTAATTVLTAGRVLAEAPAVPTQAELQAMVDQGQYTEALKGIAKALPLANDASKGYSKRALYMLRGEAMLQEKQVAAADSFSMARHESTSLKDAAMPIAMETLVKRSPGFKYAPKSAAAKKADPGTNVGGIDILPKDSRKQALLALFEDEFAAIQPRFKEAKSQKSLPPLVDFARSLGMVSAMELAATGDTAQTKGMIGEIATHAQSLMNATLQSMEKKIDTIKTDANQTVDRTVTVPSGKKTTTKVEHYKRGLTTGNADDLHDILATCDKIIAAANDLAILFADQADGFKSVKSTAETTKQKANEVLHADYKGQVGGSGKGGKKGG